MMRPTSLYSIPPDPYRNRRSSTKEEPPTTTTTTTTTTAITATPKFLFVPEPGRAHSYLPYSNHAPDFKQSRTELYVEDDTMTMISSNQVDMINGEHTTVQHTFSLTAQDEINHNNRGRKASDQTDLSLTDKLRLKRQQNQKQSHFYTPSSRRIFIIFCVMTAFTILSIIIYFCWPRIPTLSLKSEKVERIGDPADWGPNHQPWLRAAWKLNMTLDNTVNFVPTRIHDIELVLLDRDTDVPFAWSRTGPIQLAPYKDTLYSLVFRVNYESSSVNDTTFKNLYNACGPQIPTESPVLNVTMQAIVHITGLVWSSVLMVRPAEGEGLRCPFN